MKYGCYTFIIENRYGKIPGHLWEYGWGNGYVLLPKFHPFYGIHYDDINVNIHGGLTYSTKFKSDNFSEWIKNYEIGGDVNEDNFKDFDDYWIIGFDTGHSGDNSYNWSKSNVLNEANDLLDQCLDIKEINIYKRKLRSEKLKKITKKG
jgi:hypothetical protein